MKVAIEVELQPFLVPNYVLEKPRAWRRQDGLGGARTHRLRDLDVDTLDRLCSDFRDEVFHKAGKRPPPAGGGK